MATLSVDEKYLEQLATKQGQAATKAQEAASAASNTATAVWVTHGVISGSSNGAFVTAENQRRGAGRNIGQHASDLAAKLRAAKQTYEGVDEDLSANLNKQMLDH
ncbi:ESX-1 secretion-associated protein [Mycobacterium montefiorense]|uniref:ESX-1 secretion-associated protein n=2 Tax=Mycobacterium montefiorense TaxID=154654 RepID=UPI0021F36571|nr:ESX-1 secretion-associated protein [Mycobacterium montefiorense]MCV7429652.1 ESX-1 secretion-associated protein [Mycobacterium montefiorense]